MQNGCKYRGSVHPSFQFKLRRRQRKVVPWGHVILFSEFIWVKELLEQLLLDENKQNYKENVIKLFGWYINASLGFKNKVLVVNYCTSLSINCSSSIESFSQTNIHSLKNNTVVLQLQHGLKPGKVKTSCDLGPFSFSDIILTFGISYTYLQVLRYEWPSLMNLPSIFYWLVIKYLQMNADDPAVGLWSVKCTIIHGDCMCNASL